MIHIERDNKKLQALWFALAATFVWGLFAHLFCFTNSIFSHDSLSEFFATKYVNAHRIELGRFAVIIYRAIFRTSGLTLPWIIGFLGLLWIGLSVFFTLDIFNVESKVTGFLIAGVLAVNTAVSATAATYLHDFDADMFALLCSTAAVYCWKKVKWGEIPGALLIAFSLGLYQSYISVSITLIMISCILMLLDETDYKQVFVKGIRAVAMLLAGGILYYIAMNLAVKISGTPLSEGGYNSLDLALGLTPGNLLGYIWGAIFYCCHQQIVFVSPFPSYISIGIMSILILISACIVMIGLANKKISWIGKLMCLALIALLPIGMNVVYILTRAMVHDLMEYAFCLSFVLAMLLADWMWKKTKTQGAAIQRVGRASRWVCLFLVFVLTYGNVQTANTIYLKKDLEYDSTNAFMTRVLYKIEENESYVPEETPVVFVGEPAILDKVIPGFDRYYGITGNWDNSVVGGMEDYRYDAYFKYLLNYNINLGDWSLWEKVNQDPRVAEMPSYPVEGCIQFLDDVMVVKIG